MTGHAWKWGFWLRLKSGKGLHMSLDVGPFAGVRLFSERNGYRKVYRIGLLKLEFLKSITEQTCQTSEN